MVLVLCIGDLHIPHRASDLPPKFKELLQPGKIHQVLCPGNLCSREVLDYLKTVCGSVHLTRGDFDDLDAPEDKVVVIENFRVGLCHGHQVVPAGDVEALGIMMRRMDVDILITGYTHKFQVEQYEDRLIMNPGSATGAYSMFVDDAVPSFALMDLNGNKVNVYIYEMIKGEFKIRKMEYTKPSIPGLTTTAKLSEPTAASPFPNPEATQPSTPASELQQPPSSQPQQVPAEKVVPEPSPPREGPPEIPTMGSGVLMGPTVSSEAETAKDPVPEKTAPPPIPSPDEIDEVTFGAIEDSV